MGRRKFKWKFGFFFFILLLSAFTKSLPIQKSDVRLPSILTSDSTYGNLVIPDNFKNVERSDSSEEKIQENIRTGNRKKNSTAAAARENILRNQLRPGQDTRNYDVEISINGRSFQGITKIEVRLTVDTRENPIKLYVEDLDISSIEVTRGAGNTEQISSFTVKDGILEFKGPPANLMFVTIEYSGSIRMDGTGIFMSNFQNEEYLGMNLYPTHARRVFPCIDDLTEAPQVTFTFNDIGYSNIIANSVSVDDNPFQFRSLGIAPHLWGMIAHNFPSVLLTASGNVMLYGRRLNQELIGSTALTHFYTSLNDWTAKNYNEILNNQHGTMTVFALPETSVDWHALSTVCIWEPYIYMELDNSVAHRYKSLVSIGEALSGQWFGFVLYPENWRHQWVITGLQSYATNSILKEFPDDIDSETLFVTEVIQESLLRDGYAIATPVLPSTDIFSKTDIRAHINGIIKYKAPAILNMLKNIMGETDYIQEVAQSLLRFWSLQPLTTLDFFDQIEIAYSAESNKLIDGLHGFMGDWVENRGYPFITVQLGTNNRITVLRNHFAFTEPLTNTIQEVPLSYTTSIAMDFDNVQPVRMLRDLIQLDVTLPGDEDFVLFNIQGQGYYRVNYDETLWNRIIDCLQEPDCRNQIHPLNRATLIDDALNLARADILSYSIALEVVLTMEHETEYAPWRAFVRNMNFLRKRLVAYVTEDQDLDPDIYMRMVGRVIGTFENELSFVPNPEDDNAMSSLTRGLVMDHACRAGYPGCLAAAVDAFFDPNSDEPAVNPNIPKDIRPAVYCAMAREGGDDVINALTNRLDEEPSLYERIVILESLTCSRDDGFIWDYLLQTIADDSPYGVEERAKILTAVIESSYENARAAITFVTRFTTEIKKMYGVKNFEDILFVLAENAANDGMREQIENWVTNQFNNLGDSEKLARVAAALAKENVVWDNTFLEPVYEWIEENDAPKVVLSTLLLVVTLGLIFLNQ